MFSKPLAIAKDHTPWESEDITFLYRNHKTEVPFGFARKDPSA